MSPSPPDVLKNTTGACSSDTRRNGRDLKPASFIQEQNITTIYDDPNKTADYKTDNNNDDGDSDDTSLVDEKDNVHPTSVNAGVNSGGLVMVSFILLRFSFLLSHVII